MFNDHLRDLEDADFNEGLRGKKEACVPLHATIALALESRGLHVHHGDIVVAQGLAFAVWACAASAEGVLFLVVEQPIVGIGKQILLSAVVSPLALCAHACEVRDDCFLRCRHVSGRHTAFAPIS